MKIVLVCATGMSTSMLIEKMEQYALEDDVIFACGRNDIEKHMAAADCFLVAPQIRYLFDAIQKECAKACVAVELIDLQSYGQLDGKRVMKQAMRISEKTSELKKNRVNE